MSSNTSKILCFAFVSLASPHLQAQMVTPFATSSGGQSTTNNGVMVEWNLGGLTVQSTGTQSFLYTPDLLQPYAGTTTTLPVFNAGVRLDALYGIDNAGTTLINVAGGNNLMIEFTTGEVSSKSLINSGQLLTQGILQPYLQQNQSPLPVTGLHLTARRLDAGRVQLNWRTIQEFTNKGFHIERRNENENGFQALGFVASIAPAGNSSNPLAYQQVDNNSFTGKSWYRLKQEDLDGRWSYSNIALVNGQQTAILQAWPIPAPRDFQVRFQGSSTDELLVYDATGRRVRQVKLRAGEAITISGLPAGSYVLRLKGQPDLSQQVIVQ